MVPPELINKYEDYDVTATPALPNYKYKILLLGSGKVGKTSLVRAFAEKKFAEDYLATVGVNLVVKDIVIPLKDRQATVRLTIWDIAGQDIFRTQLPAYHQGAHGVFFVADLTWPQSFEALDQWHAEVVKNKTRPLPVVLLANKCDLKQVVGDSTIAAAAQRVGAKEMFKTSAKTGQNVHEAFLALAQAIVGREKTI